MICACVSPTHLRSSARLSTRDAVGTPTPTPPGWGRPAEIGLEMGAWSGGERRKDGEEIPGPQVQGVREKEVGEGSPSPQVEVSEDGIPADPAGALTRTM